MHVLLPFVDSGRLRRLTSVCALWMRSLLGSGSSRCMPGSMLSREWLKPWESEFINSTHDWFWPYGCNSSRHETKLIRLGGALRISTTMFSIAGVHQLMMGLMFIIFAATGNSLQAQQVFTSLALLSVLRRIGAGYLIRCFFLVYEMNVAVQRIQVFS